MKRISSQISAKYSPDNSGLFVFKDHLERAGLDLAYPVGDHIIEYSLGFAVTVPHERETPFHLTELDFLRAIARSDVQITYNMWAKREGYIGESTGIETAYALLLGKPTILVRPIQDLSPDLPPSIAEILVRHAESMLVEPIDLVSPQLARQAIRQWQGSRRARCRLSIGEQAEVTVQAAILACKYQVTWEQYTQLREMADGGGRDAVASE